MRSFDKMKKTNDKKPKTKVLKRLLRQSKRYWGYEIACFILAIIAISFDLTAPTYLGELTNYIAIHSNDRSIDFGVIKNLAIILMVMYAVGAISRYIAAFLNTTACKKFARDLAKDVSVKINKLPLRYFDTHSYGDTMSRVTNDVNSISTELDYTLIGLIMHSMMFIGALTVMFITSWRMTLVTFISIPLLTLFAFGMMKITNPLFKARQDQTGAINGVVEEHFSGTNVIKLFNAEEKMQKKFEKSNQRLGKTMFKAQICGGLIDPVSVFIGALSGAAILTAGGIMISKGVPGINYGTITEFLVYARCFQQPIERMAEVFYEMEIVKASAARVFEFVDEEDMAQNDVVISEEERAKFVKEINGSVDFEHVNFSYDESREIIHDFNAKIKPGMKVAIVGPTGAGKTTMVNLLMRFYDVNSGAIKIDGVDISSLSRQDIHDIFGMVLQDTWVFKGTIRDNIIYNSKPISDEELKEVCKKANIYYFVRTLPNKFDYVIENEDSISSGQRQLITIARAMVRNAPLLILDEATSNVDTRTEEYIQEAMDELTHGRTSFVIAHRLSTIKNADLILVMKDGDIIEQGTHDDLMQKEGGFYANLYESQFVMDA